MSNDYQAGVCNIGDKEVAHRRNLLGFGGLTVVSALYIILVFLNFPIWGYASLLIPVYISTAGFWQSKNRFCTAYGISGQYNMNSEPGQLQDIISRSDRAKDHARAKKMTNQTLAMSVFITLALIALSRFIAS